MTEVIYLSLLITMVFLVKEVDLYLSGVMMNLLLEGDEQLETQLDISLISPENFEEWFNAIITVNYKVLGNKVDEKSTE